MIQSMVSVLMPAYNCEPYIVAAITSILQQTHTNLELLICDDGSSDRTWELINTFTDSRIAKYKNGENKGYLFTYNFLLNKANGEFITCQDADDWSDITRLEQQLSIFVKFPDIYLCGCNGTFYYSEVVQRPCPEFESGIVKLRNANFNFMLPAVLYKREVLAQVSGFHNFFDRLTGMDQYFILSIISNFKSYELNSYLYFARFNSTSNHRTFDSLRKMTAPDVYFFLRKQRVETGTDWLDQGREDLIYEFENKLLGSKQYMAEKYREYAVYRIDSGQLTAGFELLLVALRKWPFNRSIYRTIVYALRKLFTSQ